MNTTPVDGIYHGKWFIKASPIQPWNGGKVEYHVAGGCRQGRPLTFLKNDKGREARFPTKGDAEAAFIQAIETGRVTDKDTR